MTTSAIPSTALPPLSLQYAQGQGVTSSFRRAQAHYARAIELGSPAAVENMNNLTADKQTVTDEVPTLVLGDEINTVFGGDSPTILERVAAEFRTYYSKPNTSRDLILIC